MMYRDGNGDWVIMGSKQFLDQYEKALEEAAENICATVNPKPRPLRGFKLNYGKHKKVRKH